MARQRYSVSGTFIASLTVHVFWNGTERTLQCMYSAVSHNKFPLLCHTNWQVIQSLLCTWHGTGSQCFYTSFPPLYVGLELFVKHSAAVSQCSGIHYPVTKHILGTNVQAEPFNHFCCLHLQLCCKDTMREERTYTSSDILYPIIPPHLVM
jgi:hypothetical protein